MRATDFRPLSAMTKVRGFFIDNPLGRLEEALRVAKDHGCEPLQIGRDVIESIQNADPRPR